MSFTRALRRRLQRRSKLVRSRTRAKNECHAVRARNLKGRPPVTDVFGKRGREWLAAIELPADERETVECCLREVDFLDSEVGLIERELARQGPLLGARVCTRLRTKASTSASSPSRSRPLIALSRTGSPSLRAVRARHGGARLQVIFLTKRQQRGREQPQNLRFSSSSPAPATTLPQRRKIV